MEFDSCVMDEIEQYNSPEKFRDGSPSVVNESKDSFKTDSSIEDINELEETENNKDKVKIVDHQNINQVGPLTRQR